MSSYQYPYIEHFSPSPATSTPQAFAQWDIQDQQQEQPTTVSPLQQPLPISEPSSTPTYEPPQTIQLQERQPRRVRVAPSTPARDSGKYPQQQPTPQTNPPASSKWFDVRESSKSDKNDGTGPVRQSTTQRSQARLSSHPYRDSRANCSTPGVEGRPARRYDSPAAISPIVMACGTPPENPSSPPSPDSPSLSPTRKYLIRTDVYFSAATNVLTAMLELPGVKKTNLRLSLGACPYSQVMQLTVWGRASPIFCGADGGAEAGYTVRERKYGEFKRVLVVPPETKAENVKASLEDGILILTYPAGKPAKREELATITIN